MTGLTLTALTNDGDVLPAYMEPPVTRGLEVLAFFGVDEARSRRNRAGVLLARANKFGAPAFSASAATGLNIANALEFPVPESDNETLLIFGKIESTDVSIAGNRPGIGGHYDGAQTPIGSGILVTGATTVRVLADYMEGAPAAPVSRFGSLPAYDTTHSIYAPRAWAMTITNGVGHSGYDLTRGSLVNYANVNPRAKSSRGTRFGSVFSAYAGGFTCYGGMRASVAWTKSELDQNAAWMAAFIKKYRGITGLIPGV